MFLKPFKVKTNTQLKGTERKKLCEEVRSAFPSLTENDVQNLLSKKEVISSMKILSHSGEICKLYCVAKIPMFFQIDQSPIELYPTIYTLWHHPNLLYHFKTHESVVSKLTNGANLMLPGVILNGPVEFHSYGKLQRNSLVCITTDGNQAAVGVGLTSLSSTDMYMSAGRGKCVDIVHIIGDSLCQLGKPPPRPLIIYPVFEHENLEIPIEQNNELDANCSTTNKSNDNLDEGIESINLSNDENQVNVNTQESTNIDDELNKVKPNDSENEEDEEEEEKESLDPIKDMDKLLEYSFLKACKGLKKTEIPLLSSTFFKNHLIPACPPNQIIDIKKSSYKKLSVFLAHMKSQGVIDTSIIKGVESIIYLRNDHPLLKELVILEEKIEPSDINNSSNKPVVSECYKVTADVLPILSKFGYSKGDVLKRAEIRKCFFEYIKNEKLQEGSMMKINPQLADALRTKENVLQLTMEHGINKFIGRMTHTHEITVNGTTLFHSGRLEPIEITIATRNNKKKVTLVSNLETFGIKLDEFSKECQGIGASATVTDVPGKKAPSVLVQGNQVIYVYKLLTDKYHIHKNYIRGLEYAPKKRK